MRGLNLKEIMSKSNMNQQGLNIATYGQAYQCWETSFYFRALNTCWVIYSLLFSHVFLSFFSAILRCALLCYCSCACFLGYLVNQLFYIFEHLFILVEDRLVKILSFYVFVSPGDVAFLLKRGT